MSKKRPIPARAGKWVRQELHPMLAEGVLAGKWDYALGLAESENRALLRNEWVMRPRKG
jgi:hypothetical protein